MIEEMSLETQPHYKWPKDLRVLVPSRVLQSWAGYLEQDREIQ